MGEWPEGLSLDALQGKRGRKTMTMMEIAKKMGRATSAHARATTGAAGLRLPRVACGPRSRR